MASLVRQTRPYIHNQKTPHLPTRTSKDVKQGSKVVSDYTKIQFNYHVFCDLKAAFVTHM